MEVNCWLVRMEWCPPGLSMCLPLVILPSTIKSRRSFLLAPAHPGGPGKRAVKQLRCGGWWLLWDVIMPSLLRHCWLEISKSVWPVKIEWWGACMVICPGCPEKEAIKQVSVCMSYYRKSYMLLSRVVFPIILSDTQFHFQGCSMHHSLSVHVLTVPWLIVFWHIFAFLVFTIYGTE